jgi:uncharacterized protein (TIGR02598 family)
MISGMKRVTPTFLKAFSLVETVLAIGIMGLAITALLGLLPHGIEMTRQAGNENAYARILNTVRTELMRMPFDTLQSTADNQLMRFDEQGVLLPPGASNYGLNAQSFLVLVDYRGRQDNGIVLTGGSGTEAKLHNFAIHIAATGLSDYNFRNVSPKAYRTFPMLVGPNYTTTN